MKKTVLREYAKLIAKTGVNVQKGQEVFIQAELDQPEFVAMVVDRVLQAEGEEGRRRLELSAAYEAARALPLRQDSVHARQL